MPIVDLDGVGFQMSLNVRESRWDSRIEVKMATSDRQFWSLISRGTDVKRSSVLFPERSVESVYFDTVNFENDRDSEEGIFPRYKVRLRSYNGAHDNCFLELKESTAFGRRKISIPIERGKKSVNELRFRGAVLKPILVVKYSRQYFAVDGMRATRDFDIEFSDVFGLRSRRCPDIVHEIKHDGGLPPCKFDMEHPFGFSTRRFSKFCSAVMGLGLG